MKSLLAGLDIRHVIHSGTSPGKHAAAGPLVFTSGKGVWLKDEAGREYIDTFGAMGSMIAGYGRSEIAAAIAQQALVLPYSTLFFGYSTPPAILLAEKLASLTPGDLDYVYFTSGGSEANETAFKISRFYYNRKGKDSRQVVISRRLSYHGQTLATLAATGLDKLKTGFGPSLPGFEQISPPYCYRCDFHGSYPGCGLQCACQLEKAIISVGEDRVAAFIAEPVMGSGGCIVPPPEYFPVVREICAKHDVMFIADEVVTGFGRTGKFFGMEHWDVLPDIMSVAKGITSGYLPLGAVIVRGERYRALLEDPGEQVFGHGFTYSGHAACCAAGLKNIEILEKEKLIHRSATVGSYFIDRLREMEGLPLVGEIRGLGLMLAVELVTDRKTRSSSRPPGSLGGYVYARALENGVILRNAGDIITFRPPLIISEEEIDTVIRVLKCAIESAAKEFI